MNDRLKIEYVPIKSLIPAVYNPRQMTEKQAHDLEESIKRFGLVDPAIVNKYPGRENIIIGGHQRLKVAERLGIETAPVVFVSLNEEQEKELNLRLNKNLGEWDIDLLSSFDTDLLLNVGFTDEELTSMFQLDMSPEPTEGKDDIPEPPVEPRSKLGDLYQLGRHRLLCGDSTKREDVERLMGGEKAELCFTSPPYNAGAYTLTGNIVKKDKSSRYGNNFSDDLPEDEYVNFLINFTKIALDYCSLVAVNIQQLANNKFAVLRWVNNFFENFVDRAVWYKGHGNPAMAKNVMASRFEDIWIWSPKKKPSRSIETADFRGTVENVVLSSGASSENIMPECNAATMPMAICDYAINSWTKNNASIYDSFGGSGSTLIACEKTNRRCFMMELDPVYIDVIIQRWETFIGQKAVKL